MIWDEVEKSKFKEDHNTDSADKSDKALSGAIFRRVMEDDNPKKTSYEEVELTSPALQRLFLKICLTRVPPGDEKSFESSTILIKSPFVDFIWFWDELENACQPMDTDPAEESLARGDLKQVMALIRKSAIEPYFKMREASLAEGSSATIPYEYLWTIYRPGTMVYAKSYLDEWQMFEVINCARPIIGLGDNDSKNPAKFTGRRFLVTGAAFDWDGSRFYVYEYDFYIKRDNKKGEVPMQIQALEIFPTTYYRNDTESDDRKLRADLVQRGRKFWQFCNIESDDIQCNYEGAVLVSSGRGSHLTSYRQGENDDNSTSFSDSDEGDDTTFKRTKYHGNAIVDAESYLRSQQWLRAEPPLADLRTDVWTGADLECRWYVFYSVSNKTSH